MQESTARLTGQTKVVALIGDPVEHSLSPAMQNAAFAAQGLDWAYVALPVKAQDVGAAVAGLRALGFQGANVTMPHKAAVIPHLDAVAPGARLIGAVNTIVRQGDRLVGEDTDGQGFIRALREKVGLEPRGRR
ncbi:MAG TPA: shikimate dehydrogenase, partial [Firmicutes bacterium]|nr:shikimate dehydrogenase [Bacillota bacterium]